MLPSTGQPFVLLDDARPGGAKARLYRDPLRVLRADRPDELAPLLEALGAASADGLHAAGYLAYEAGLALEPRLAHRLPTDQPSPLGWFGLFKRYEMFDAKAWPDPAGAWLSDFTPDITRGEYDAAFAEAIDLIEAGDIYQANLTFRTHAGFAGDPRALFAALRDRARAGYGALVHDGVDWLLSFSPELFFSLKGRAVRVKPMKGTAARLTDPVADAAAAKTLAADPKQRAENLMIVDLLRNDLSRICVPGSVVTGPLFAVETYPTVHQLVSTVRGTLAGSHNAVDLIANLFPCGSITGAPKIRAMEVIGELETSARGPYCGAIGRIDADGDAAFNVAIRTLCLKAGVRSVSLGLGSGVVADSLAGTEWAECQAKGGFARMKTSFDLIETMAFDPRSGLIRIERHLERLKDSARTFGFECDRHQLRNDLHAATFQLAEPSKVRLLLARSGASAIEIRPAPLHPERGWRVGLSPLPVGAEDVRLAHKTSDRDFYDAGRRAHPEWDEVLFTDPQGFLTEGSYSSLFVERGGLYHTPPLTRGLLPGVLRAELLETGQAVEADLHPEDLEKGFLCGNSLRGLVTSRLVAPN